MPMYSLSITQQQTALSSSPRLCMGNPRTITITQQQSGIPASSASSWGIPHSSSANSWPVNPHSTSTQPISSLSTPEPALASWWCNPGMHTTTTQPIYSHSNHQQQPSSSYRPRQESSMASPLPSYMPYLSSNDSCIDLTLFDYNNPLDMPTSSLFTVESAEEVIYS